MCPDLCFPSVLIFTGLQEARTHKLSVGSVQGNVNPVFALHRFPVCPCVGGDACVSAGIQGHSSPQAATPHSSAATLPCWVDRQIKKKNFFFCEGGVKTALSFLVKIKVIHACGKKQNKKQNGKEKKSKETR